VAVSPARSEDSCPGFQRHNLGGALCKARIPQLPGLGQPVMSCFFFFWGGGGGGGESGFPDPCGIRI
jgi:hypothetical protein